MNDVRRGAADFREKLEFLDEGVRARGEGIFAVDEALRVFYWSARVEQMSGISAGAAAGRSVLDLLPFLRGGDDARLRAALAGEPQPAATTPFEMAESGRRGQLETTYAPLGGGTSVVGVYALVRDVTESRRIEEELRETERRFQNMADASPVLLWMSGTDSLCNFFNATWLEFTGRPLDQELGVGWAEGVHFEDFQRCMDTYVEAFGARRRFEMEYRLRRADGEYRWLLDRGTPRYSPDGRFEGYIGSCVDITEHKRLEGELRLAVRDRDDFMSIAAHELRTPLTPLQLALEKMQREFRRDRGGPDPERLRRAVDSAGGHVSRMAGLVEELLDVSRLTSGRQLELEPRDFDLADLAVEVTMRFAEEARDAGCSLEVDAVARVVGHWDRQRVDRAITNLVTNAIKYGPGAPIEVTVKDAGDFGIVEVRDHGIGIDPSDQERIFGRFERAVSMRHYGGFGLGLWIVRQLAEAHGGTVAVESARGAGSTFTISLPKKAAAASS